MNTPYVVKETLKPGADYPAVVIYKLGDEKRGYMPTDQDLQDFRDLLESSIDDMDSVLITHYACDVELVYIPRWIIKLDNAIRRIVEHIKSVNDFFRWMAKEGKKGK